MPITFIVIILSDEHYFVNSTILRIQHLLALKWWIQSYLAGIKQLVIGLHENLKLNRVDLLDVNSLSKFFCKENINPTSCFAFLYLFLQTVKSYLDQAVEGDILIAECLPNSNEFNFKLLEAGSELSNNYCVVGDEFKANGWL